jgi:hypothetical protein
MLREEKRLRVFENRVLRGIFGPEKDKVTGGWRKLQIEELHNFNIQNMLIRIKSSREHSAHEEDKKCVQNFG